MKQTKIKLAGCVAIGLLLSAGLSGCSEAPRNADLTPPPSGPEPSEPVVESTPTVDMENSRVAQQSSPSVEVQFVRAEDTSKSLGSATLLQLEEGLTVRFNIAANDVISAGEHAIHIHQNGSCEAEDTNNDGTPDPAGAAGGHFNPSGTGHGNDNGPHAGDSRQYNYKFNEDGSFNGEAVFRNATLQGEHSVQQPGGTSIVIHAGKDDKESDPAGDSGPRVACAVIPEMQQQSETVGLE